MDNISVVPTHKPHYLSLVITFKAKQSNFSMHLPLKVSVNLGDVICKSSRSFLLWWSSNTHTSKVNLSKVTLFQENILTAFSNNHLPMQKKKNSPCTLQIPAEVSNIWPKQAPTQCLMGENYVIYVGNPFSDYTLTKLWYWKNTAGFKAQSSLFLKKNFLNKSQMQKH